LPSKFYLPKNTAKNSFLFKKTPKSQNSPIFSSWPKNSLPNGTSKLQEETHTTKVEFRERPGVWNPNDESMVQEWKDMKATSDLTKQHQLF